MSANPTILKHILFKIVAIEEISFSMDSLITGHPNDIDIDIEGDTTTNRFDKTITISSTINFSLIKLKRPVLHYSIVVKFYVENYDEVVKMVDDQSIVDALFENELIDITLHTARGMLYAKTVGTGLATCYLPLVD